jgi:hypothetical protein
LVPVTLSSEMKRQRHEADRWAPASADVKDSAVTYTPALPYIVMAECSVINAQGQLNFFTFTIRRYRACLLTAILKTH